MNHLFIQCELGSLGQAVQEYSHNSMGKKCYYCSDLILMVKRVNWILNMLNLKFFMTQGKMYSSIWPQIGVLQAVFKENEISKDLHNGITDCSKTN